MEHTDIPGIHPEEERSRGPEGLHVLLVEDDPNLAETMAALLSLAIASQARVAQATARWTSTSERLPVSATGSCRCATGRSPPGGGR
jgi:hypothetical protein